MRRVFRLGVGKNHLGHEVDDEIAFHLETKIARLVARGVPVEEARRRAAAEFGDAERVRLECLHEDQLRERAMRRMNILDQIRQDAGFAIRTMRHNPLFATIVVLTLGLGIAANTSIFTLVNALLLRQLPVESPEELVAIGDTRRTSAISTGNPRADMFSYQLYRDVRANSRIMPDIMASGRSPSFQIRTSAAVPGDGAPARFVSGNYFRVLRVPALLGRTFDGREDDNLGASPYAVISYGLWKRRFGADTSVVGKRIYVSGAAIPMTVIGVTPSWFTGEIVAQPTDIWFPITMQEVLQPNEKVLADRSTNWLLLMGRRPPGATLEQVAAALTPVIKRSIVDHPVPGLPYDSTGKMFFSSGARGFSRVRADFGTPLKTLMAGVGLLLLIICANVANLMLARALARSKEMGVRMAIGAGRERLLRQLFTESLMLGVLGGAVGLTGAVWGSRLMLRLAADGGLRIPIDVGIDVPVLAFTAVLAIVAVVLFGFVPAIRSSRVDLAGAMRANAGAVIGGGMTSRGQRMPLGRLLIGGQVALSLVLLVGASLLVRSLREIQTADPGLDRQQLLHVDVNAIPNGYTQERLNNLAVTLATRLATVPGIKAVSYSENGLFYGTESQYNVNPAGYTASKPTDTTALADVVGPGYVSAIGGRLLRGRDITPSDVAGSANVILVNESMAKHFFGAADPIGRSVRIDDTTWTRIVGVIADVKDHSLTERAFPRIYFAYAQHTMGWSGALRLIIRTAGSPNGVVPQIRPILGEADSRFRNSSAVPVSDLMRDSVAQERLLARLASGFGLMALLLAAIGLYGVMTYAVTRRTAEIGLRVALGADGPRIVRMVLRDAMSVVLVGVVIGVPIALGAAGLLKAQLYGVTTTDPVSITVAVVVMATSAALAALAPALRASRVAPLLSLRQE